MYSENQNKSINGIAGMFYLVVVAMTGLIVFSMPYLIRGGFILGTFVGKGIKRVFKKT